MSNFTPLDEQYPNELLGLHGASDAEAGAVNQLDAPLKLATAAGATGCIFNSGSGAPGVGGNIGDLYFRTDGGSMTYLYRCTTAGVAGAAVWTGIL